jgi:hypothetical protein
MVRVPQYRKWHRKAILQRDSVQGFGMTVRGEALRRLQRMLDPRTIFDYRP